MEKIELYDKTVKMSAFANQILINDAVRAKFGIDFGMGLLDINTLLNEIGYFTDKRIRIYVYLNNHHYYLCNSSSHVKHYGYSNGMLKMELKLYSHATEK